MSLKDGKPDIDLDPSLRVLVPGNALVASGRFYKRVNGVYAFDNTGPIEAFICARDHHTRVPSYNPLPVTCTSLKGDGKWDFVCSGDAIRPSLLRAIFYQGTAYLIVLQHGVSRSCLPLTVQFT